MTTDDQARERYIAEYQCFVEAATTMEGRLLELVRQLGIRASIEVRAKTVGSFVKKVNMWDWADPWLEIEDKVGGRVIVKTLHDLDRVHALFEQNPPPFEVRWIKDKSAEGKVGELFYPGVHVQVAVPGVTTADGEPIECEIQLRTKAQDLWAVPSHELVYKGVIEPSRQTARRILRLSVLTEMFDEEVRLAMEEVASDPRYANALVLRAAESLYLTFVAEPGEDELSLEVLDVVMPAVPEADRPNYPAILKSFVEGNSEKLRELFKTYGVYSDFAQQWAYSLFSQPEALVVLERVQAAPQALAEAVTDTDMHDAVRHLYAAWGASMPDLV